MRKYNFCIDSAADCGVLLDKLTVHPFSRERLAVLSRKNTLAVALVFPVNTLVCRAILILHATLAVPLALHPGAAVRTPIEPKLRALAMLEVLEPRTVIDRRPLIRLWIVARVLTQAVVKVVLELPLVHVAIRVDTLAFAVSQVVLVFTLVLAVVGHFVALAVLLVVEERTLVRAIAAKLCQLALA